MISCINLVLDGTDRRSIRKQLVESFLEEEAGSGTGENCSVYRYYVETLQNGKRIYLKRPARLNKGFDFEVNVEGTLFGTTRRTQLPSHSSIHQDLLLKLAENVGEFNKMVALINRIYNCERVDDSEMVELKFDCGYTAETMLKAIKWLFIEQDITYWNWSGRNMLYNKLSNTRKL